MLCSNDPKQGHKGIAIELASSYVFESLGHIRFSAVIVSKLKKSLNAIQGVVSNDAHCWSLEDNVKTQISPRVFLCHFHIMKGESENLLTRVPNEDKNRVCIF